MESKKYITKFLSTYLIFTNLFQFSSTVEAADDDNKIECSICLEERDKIQYKDKLTTLKCGHQFCTDCIKKWKDTKWKPTCPLCRAEIKEDNNDNNNDFDQWQRDNDQFWRDMRAIDERNAQIRREIDELIERRRKRREKYQDWLDKMNAPTGEDGMTKYEREYYEKNYKKILDDGLGKISHANSESELSDISDKCENEINKLIDKTSKYMRDTLGLHPVNMEIYTRKMLYDARKKRWNEIKPIMTPGRAVLGAITSAGIGIEAYSYWKQNHPESYSQDIGNNIYDLNTIDTNGFANINDITNNTDSNLNTTVSDNDSTDIINILGNKDDNDNSIQNVFEILT